MDETVMLKDCGYFTMFVSRKLLDEAKEAFKILEGEYLKGMHSGLVKQIASLELLLQNIERELNR